MKDVSYFLRQAYTNLLEPLEIEGVTIPFFDEVVNPRATIPTFKGAECYVVFSGQNEVETTNNRCSFRESVAVTLQIFAKFPLGTGGKLATELISNEIQDRVNILNSNGVTLSSPFQILRTRKISAQTLVFNGMNSTTYQKNLSFSHVIYQDSTIGTSNANTIQQLIQFQI